MTPLLLPWVAGLAWATPVFDRPGEVMPDRRWDMVHLDLEVRIDLDRQQVEGVATHTVRPLGRPSGWLRLHQVDLDIEAVEVDGKAVEGWHTGPQTLDIPVPVGREAHEVTIRYRAEPKTGMHFRGGRRSPDPVREVWTQGENEDNRYWFPGWDYPNDTFTVTTTVVVPDGMVAFANGVRVEQASDSPGWTRWTYALERPIVNYLVAVVAGELASWEDDGPVPLTYIAPATVPEEALRRSLSVTTDQMVFFQDLLDSPFPYPVYRQAFVSRFLYGGMENATLTTLADTLLLAHEADRDVRTEEVVAHELAHQWFGDLLTCYGWRELWLNEGFATFYTGRWLEHRYGPERYAVKVRRWMEAALRDPAPMSPRPWSKVDGRDYAAVYVRGAAVLHMLRTWLGDAVFDEAIRTYVERNSERLVQTEDLRRALEDSSGVHLGWLFDQWVHGVGAPAVTTHWTFDAARRGGPTLTVTLEQSEETAFSAPVQVEIGTHDDVLRQEIWLGPGQTRLDLPLSAAPRWVGVDPAGGVLAHWTHHQPVEAWAAQALHSPAPYARLVALEQLGEAYASREALHALTETLRQSLLEPGIRAAAARSLGTLGTEEALQVLVHALADDAPELREAAADALGMAPPGQVERVRPALVRATADVDAGVRSHALGALARLDHDQAVRVARQRLGQPDRSAGRRVHEQALRVLATHGDRSDLRLVYRFLDPSTPRDPRQAAASALADLLSRLELPDAQHRRGEEALLALLDSPDLTDRRLAVHLLGRVGGASAAAALQAFARQTPIPRLADGAREASRRIRTRDQAAAPPPPDASELKERLEVLEERLEWLEGRW